MVLPSETGLVVTMVTASIRSPGSSIGLTEASSARRRGPFTGGTPEDRAGRNSRPGVRDPGSLRVSPQSNRVRWAAVRWGFAQARP
ncbi:hypothetical protein GCM10018789_51020 [Streptomyces werraensis]|nr:hypothetical protein GCM10018789_51020 [Streptomyces werraensis]